MRSVPQCNRAAHTGQAIGDGHRGQSPRWFGDSPLVGLRKMRTQNLGFRHLVGEVASEVHFPLFHPIISWDVLNGFGYRDDEWFRRLHFLLDIVVVRKGEIITL